MWDDLIEGIIGEESSRISSALTKVNEDIRESLVSGREYRDYSATALARIILFKALSVYDSQTQDPQNNRKINIIEWKPVVEEIHAFVASLPDRVRAVCCNSISDDMLSGFATLSSRRKGSTKAYFYSTLQLYIIWCAAKGNLNSQHLELIISREDRTSIHRARRAISEEIRTGLALESSAETSEVQLSIQIKKSDQDEVAAFAQRAFLPIPGRNIKLGFQFLVYRPMRRDPDQLLRTFVSVYEKADSFQPSRGFTYSHHYRPPNELGQLRFSTGKVFPLNDAVYLVGGQRLDLDHGIRRPFDSLKVIVVRWRDIRKFHQVFPVLIMTSSYDNKVMVSRGAARLTPIGHSKEAPLSPVLTKDINSSLSSERKSEIDFITKMEGLSDEQKKEALGRFPLTADAADIKGFGKEIVRFANNNPEKDSGIAAPGGFRRRKGDPLTLETDWLRYMISKVASDEGEKIFTNSEEDKFNLWEHLRYGPLRFE